MTGLEALAGTVIGVLVGLAAHMATTDAKAYLVQRRGRVDHRVLCALSRAECQRADELRVGWGVFSSLTRLRRLGLVEMLHSATADGVQRVYRLTARGVRYRDVRDRAERELLALDDMVGAEDVRRQLAAAVWLPEDASWKQIYAAAREGMDCEATLVELAELLSVRLSGSWRRDVVIAARLMLINAKLGARDADRYAMLQVASTAVLESLAIETAQHLPSCQCAPCVACLRLQKALAEARNVTD